MDVSRAGERKSVVIRLTRYQVLRDYIGILFFTSIDIGRGG